MFTYILYALAIVGLAVSFFKDRQKTKMAALMKAWKAFENILPQILTIFLDHRLCARDLSAGDDSAAAGVGERRFRRARRGG